MNQAHNLKLMLIAKLKDLPKDFGWDYANPNKCAVQVYRQFVQDPGTPYETWPEIGQALGLDEPTTCKIFFCATGGRSRSMAGVTPKLIAKLLESTP